MEIYARVSLILLQLYNKPCKIVFQTTISYFQSKNFEISTAKLLRSTWEKINIVEKEFSM